MLGVKFIGEGKNGKVYMLPDGKVIKTYKNIRNCLDECHILEQVSGSKHFPRLYECNEEYMIREFVAGENLADYIEKNGLSRTLALNLIELIEDFKKLGFTRLDMRCAHIYVQKGEAVMVIDPRGHYRKKMPYPRSLLSGLRKLGVLEKFLHVLKKERPSLYDEWTRYIK